MTSTGPRYSRDLKRKLALSGVAVASDPGSGRRRGLLPYRPAREPVMVSAMRWSCCDDERDDDKLLARVETVLQQHAIVE